MLSAPHGRKRKWISSNCPSWWPSQIRSGTPNYGETRLSVSEADIVITACKDFLLKQKGIDKDDIDKHGKDVDKDDEETNELIREQNVAVEMEMKEPVIEIIEEEEDPIVLA